MVTLQIQLFLLLAVGYVLGKLGRISPATRQQLTDLIIDVVLPCTILSSFQMDLSPQILRSSFQALAAAFGIQLLYWVLNRFLYRRLPPDQQISCKYSTMVTNASFIGIPVVTALYGPQGTLLASIFVLPQRIFMWACGLPMYTRVEKKDAVKKILTHPCILSIFVGLGLMGLYTAGFPLPELVSSTLDLVGGCSTPLCFVVIGSIVGEMPLGELVDLQVLRFSFYRLLLIPAVVFLLTLPLPLDPLARNVSVVLSAMPAGTTTVMLAQKFDRNPQFASKLLVGSTLLSMVTIPLVTGLLGLL